MDTHEIGLPVDRIAKLAITAVVIHFLGSWLIPILSNVGIAHILGLFERGPDQATAANFIVASIRPLTLLANLGFAYWISAEAKSNEGQNRLWFLFGLLAGISGVVVFYLIRIARRLASK